MLESAEGLHAWELCELEVCTDCEVLASRPPRGGLSGGRAESSQPATAGGETCACKAALVDAGCSQVHAALACRPVPVK